MSAITPPPHRPPRAGPLALTDEELTEASDRAADGLLGQQRSDGHWSYRLESNVCMEAEYLLLGRILDRADPAREARLVQRILEEQQPDGGFPVYRHGPSDVDVTVEALTALRAAGVAADDPRVVAARAAAERLGGVAATRVFTRMWLACCGLHSWEPLPELPPEIMFLPARAPLGLGQFSSWARATIVALTIVLTLRPATANVPIRRDDLPPGDGRTERPGPAGTIAQLFRGLDGILHAYRRLPRQPGRDEALRRAEAWLLDHQERDGSIGGIQPPMAYQCLALHALGYRRGHPALERAWNAFDASFIREDAERCEVQACLSPVWDTALAMLALSDLGLPGEHEALRGAARWLVDREIAARGDWTWTRPRLPAGGWAFEYHNDQYPDIDDTAIVLLALQRTEVDGRDDAVRRGLRWTLGMRSRRGGCAAFDADNTSRLVEKIPFCDFGAVIDPPSADVTAHVLEAAGAWGIGRHRDVRRMVRWLLGEQEADGSWFGRWGVNHVYGTAAAIPGLIGAGLHRLHPAVQRGVSWLLEVQHEDGAYGESCASYVDPAMRGHGEATPSQTAWGLQALCSGGEAGSGPAARAARWLLEHQDERGLWHDEHFTGTGFPGDFYLRYHGYAEYFPAAALGRYRRLRPATGRRAVVGVPIHLGQRPSTPAPSPRPTPALEST